MFIRYFVVDHHNLTGYSQIVEELDANGAVVATYHYGHDLISQSKLVVDEVSGVPEWVDRIFLYDGGGSVRALTDLEGNIADTFSYDAYGNLLQPSSLNLPTFYLYRGERYDTDLGQYYLRARFYDANLGRFHTLDEYEGRTGEPLSLHKYLYAHANPVTGWDPSGEFTLAELGIVVEIMSVAWSGYDFMRNPSLVNGGFFLIDIAGGAILSGISKGVSAARAAFIARNGVRLSKTYLSTLNRIKGLRGGKCQGSCR